MSAYILMRSNKQSGPLTKEELLQIGLKPYDLIWVEGKSALWRYPSEVPELKEYAAAVEEQPYDRFYKKKTDEPKKEEPAIVSAKNVYEERKEAEHEQYMPQKHVSVIMPKQAVAVKKEDPVYTPNPAPVKKAEPVFAPASPAAAAIAERPAEVETKYSESLDEIKERYIKQLQQRKHKTAQKKFIIQALKNAAVFIAIIGSGVLIGFAIKPKHSSKIDAVNPPPQNVSTAAAEKPAKGEETMQLNSNQPDAIQITETKQQPANNNKVVANGPDSYPALITDTKSSIVEKKKLNEEKNDLPLNQSIQPTAINTPGGERNKNSRNNNTGNESNAVSIGDISKSVSVKANNYKMRDFGGFRNLELTVTNDSKFALDNVLVELQYLNINEQALKVEHIRFQSIESGGSLTIRVPDNKRGAKVIYRVIKIEPKDLNNSSAGL